MGSERPRPQCDRVPPGPPDSKPPRKRRPLIDDTIDEADERARAATAVIERDVREGASAGAGAKLSLPRARTPADEALAAAVDEIRRTMPDWQLAEQVARGFEALGAQVDSTAARADALEGQLAAMRATAAEERIAAEVASRTAAAKASRWDAVWRWAKASGAATALAIGLAGVRALVDHGDARRAAVHQAEVIGQHTVAIEKLATAIESTNRTVAAHAPIVQIVAARLGMSAPIATP